MKLKRTPDLQQAGNANGRKERQIEIVRGLRRMQQENPAGHDRLLRLLARLVVTHGPPNK